jgi:predicted  nucleic acid-binding Zn-ribbon protein
MATPQDIQRILDQLNSTYRQLGESNPFANFDASNITNASREAQRLTDALAGAEQRLRAIDNNLDDLVGAFKAITGELSKQNVALNNTNASFRDRKRTRLNSSHP